MLALCSFPRKYNARNAFFCPQNHGFFKKKRAAEPPWKTKTEDAFTHPLFHLLFFIFQRPVKRTLDDGPMLLRTEFEFVADTLPLCAFLPRDLWIKVSFHGKSAHFDKLYDNRQNGNGSLVLDICEIPGVNIDDLSQCLARQMLCAPCSFYIGTESFKTGAIFDVGHIASPTYIVYFILCPRNVAICIISTFYYSYNVISIFIC